MTTLKNLLQLQDLCEKKFADVPWMVAIPQEVESYFKVDYRRQWRTPMENYCTEWDHSPSGDLACIRKTLQTPSRREVTFIQKLAWVV